MGGAVYGGAGPSGAGEEGFIQETSVQGRQRNYRLTEKGQRAYRNERLRLRLCLADAEREDAGERL